MKTIKELIRESLTEVAATKDIRRQDSIKRVYKQFPELKGNSKLYYDLVSKSHGKASECIECGQCEAQCPQHIDIIDKLKVITQTFEDP